MRIRTLEVDGIRAFGERTFELGDARGAAQVVAVTGPPASGKTTFLETLIVAKEDVGPYGGGPSPAHLLDAGLDVAKLRVTWQLAASEQARFELAEPTFCCETLIGGALNGPPHEPAMVALLSDYEADELHGKVEYFHARRGLPLGGRTDLSSGAGDTFDRRLRLIATDGKYESLVRFIVAAGLGLSSSPSGQAPQPGRVTRAFGALCSSKRLGGLYRDGDSVFPGFLDRREAVFALGELSDSELDALLFAATFVRAGLVNNEPGSVILIDTPERHLGDRAGAFVRALAELGPNNQLIVATTNRDVASVANIVIELGAA